MSAVKSMRRAREDLQVSEDTIYDEIYPVEDPTASGSISESPSDQHVIEQDPLNASFTEQRDIIAFNNTNDDKDVENSETHEICLDGKHDNGGVGRNRIRFLMLGALFLVLIAVVVTLSVILSQENKNAAAAAEEETSASGFALVPLPPMPAGLKDACETGFKEREEDGQLYILCAEQCDVAECCNIPPNIPGTCLTESTAQLCLEYHAACLVLTDPDQMQDDMIDHDEIAPTDIPIAPPELAQLCQPDNLSTNQGVQACSNYCAPTACCWADISPELAAEVENAALLECRHHPNCPGYWPCMFLQAHDTVHASIEDQVKAVCTDAVLTDTQQWHTCRDACKLGLCCIMEGMPCSGSGNKPQGFCRQYSACNMLHSNNELLAQDETFSTFWQDGAGGGSGTTPSLPQLPSNIANACDLDVVYSSEEATDICADMCAPGNCCHLEQGEEGSCTSPETADLCAEYALYCDVLDNPPTVPTDDDRDPQTDTTIDDGGGINFYGDDSVQQDTNQTGGAVGGSGSISFDRTKPPDLPEDIEAVCTLDFSVQANHDAYIKCETYCELAKCCQPDEETGNLGTCFDNNEAKCDIYLDYCELLESYVPPPADSTYVPASAPTTNLSQVCDESRIDANDIEACQEACKEYECCDIPENMEESCLEGNYDECMDYHKDCSVLQLGTEQVDPEIPVAPSDIATTCSLDSMSQFGPKLCRQACRVADCCWSIDEGVQSCTELANCPAYSPCLILRSSGMVEESVGAEVQEKCGSLTSASTDEAIQKCTGICMQHNCCWDLDMIAAEVACFQEDVCSQYVPCAKLLDVRS